MQTVQLALEEHLVAEVDDTVRRLGTTRSTFTQEALRQTLAKIREQDLERRHRDGYERHPVEPGEFSDSKPWPRENRSADYRHEDGGAEKALLFALGYR